MKTLLVLGITFLLATKAALAAEVPYSRVTLDRLLAEGQPVAVYFHADWCPICRAQTPILKELMSTPQLKNLTLLVANYDTELALRKSMNVAEQSTVVVFRHGKEVARSTGDTTRSGLAGLLRKAVS